MKKQSKSNCLACTCIGLEVIYGTSATRRFLWICPCFGNHHLSWASSGSQPVPWAWGAGSNAQPAPVHCWDGCLFPWLQLFRSYYDFFCIQVVNLHLVQMPCLPQFLSKMELRNSRKMCSYFVLTWLYFPCKFKVEVEAHNLFVMISPLLVVQRNGRMWKIQTIIITIKTMISIVIRFLFKMAVVYYLGVFFQHPIYINGVSTLGQALFQV